MAKVAQRSGLSHVCAEIGLEVSFSGDKKKPLGLLVKQGEKTGLIRYSECSAIDVERWASDHTRKEVFWNLPIATTEGGFELKRWYEDVVRTRPSDSQHEPGSAFLIKKAEAKGDGDLTVPILPEVAGDGSYSYEVATAGLSDPTSWKKAAMNAGFQVRLSADTKRFFGSRFPGGDRGLPPPLRLVGWISAARLPEDSAEKPKGTESKAPSPIPEGKAFKDWARVPDFVSCQGMVKTFRQRDIEGVKKAIQNPPAEVQEKAKEADLKEVSVVEKEIGLFVKEWIPSRGKQSATLPIVLRKLKTLAAKEEVYCSVFSRFREMFTVDFNSEVVRPITV